MEMFQDKSNFLITFYWDGYKYDFFMLIDR